ncbi:MAG: DNA cytosine methyltransferase [Oscillospiraceae bacterium]|nr:DNA cytosine methyltransferase [Oscillospiraceae bacterium]
MIGQFDFFNEIIVDNFAGGGGASTGIELASGRIVDIAINHDPAAILMHQTNHPHTEHIQASVWDVDPVQVCRGRPVGLAWFSPDCKHFSKAKGSALVDRNIRGLAWIVLRWAGTVRPRVIILENVEEFQTWGPVRKGKPIRSKSCQTFRQWISQIKALGYVVDHRELVAADYGAPTTRKRFVLVARCDGQSIRWPERTHAPKDSEEVRSGKLPPWRSAAEIIDWSLPMYSIFATKEEIKKKYGVNVVRPLADNTLRRAIRGVDKYTIKSEDPFLIPVGYGERAGQAPRVHDINAPVPTVVSRGKLHLTEPVMAPVTVTNTTNSVGAPADEPVHTVTTAGNQMLISANLVQCNHAGGDRIQTPDDPVPTISSHHAFGLAAANLIQYHEEKTENARAADVRNTLPTVDASNRHGLISAQLTEYYGNGNPLDIREPAHTVTAHDREALLGVHLDKYFAGGYKMPGNSAEDPLTTVTVEPRHGLYAAHVVEFKGQNMGQRAADPLRTITAGGGEFAAAGAVIEKYVPGTDMGHWPEVRALLNKYCGYTLADDEILLLRLGGALWYISDITMRMLTPRELYAAMGFPPDYIIDRDYTGRPYPKNQQVARCGNAVCPPMAKAVVQANLPEWCSYTITTMAELERVVAV